jgi:exonuclease I
MSRVAYSQKDSADSTNNAKPQNKGWWYSNKYIRLLNQELSKKDSLQRLTIRQQKVITVQDSLFVANDEVVRKAERIANDSKNNEVNANFKVQIYKGFATEQQTLANNANKKLNRTNLALGTLLGILLTIIITK